MDVQRQVLLHIVSQNNYTIKTGYMLSKTLLKEIERNQKTDELSMESENWESIEQMEQIKQFRAQSVLY